MKKSSLLKIINLWPPYLGAGVKVTRISENFTSIDVEMRLHFWNRNYVGTHFGGSLYSMTDPFFMLMLIENLGKDYVVWDKSASIRFKKPGKGIVRAHFEISEEQIKSIRAQVDKYAKVEPEFNVLIVDESGTVIAEVYKQLYVRKKNQDKETLP
jgi:acyl-coenzyme A thioesterase PaaI-like protein